MFHSLHYSQESLRHVCFLQFDLCPASTLLQQSLKSSTRPGNRFLQGNDHHISFIWAIKSGVLTEMFIQKICHKGLLQLQKIVSQPFSANRELHTAIANMNIQKWHVYHHRCQERNLQRKNFIFTWKKID